MYLDAPIIIDDEKFKVVIFSHGLAQNATFFTTIFKDLVHQGFIVYSIEHMDSTCLHFKNPAGKSKYFKNVNI